VRHEIRRRRVCHDGTGDQSQLFYLFNLDRRIPADHGITFSEFDAYDGEASELYEKLEELIESATPIADVGNDLAAPVWGSRYRLYHLCSIFIAFLRLTAKAHDVVR
jgi:hypothetical protein